MLRRRLPPIWLRNSCCFRGVAAEKTAGLKIRKLVLAGLLYLMIIGAVQLMPRPEGKKIKTPEQAPHGVFFDGLTQSART
jgi:hypothetical protein